jgi:hypothetical protein
LQNGEAADEAQRQKRRDDKERNALANIHNNLKRPRAF